MKSYKVLWTFSGINNEEIYSQNELFMAEHSWKMLLQSLKNFSNDITNEGKLIFIETDGMNETIVKEAHLSNGILTINEN